MSTNADGHPSNSRSWSSAAATNLSGQALTISAACSALPLVGRYLRPLETMTAMGAWGYRLVPDLVRAVQRQGASDPIAVSTPEPEPDLATLADRTVREFMPEGRTVRRWPRPDRLPPILSGLRSRAKYLAASGVRYGDDPAQVLDVWRAPGVSDAAPVLLFVPGGAWIHGSRLMQGHALMAHLAARGWVCLAMDYRVSPRHRWPRHISDVKAAIAWARANVAAHGGDPSFVAVAGCSAGGHLAALAGLTAGDPEYQHELGPQADTSVDAVVGVYGRYDWEDRSTLERDRFVDFLEHIVVGKPFGAHRDTFRAASPIARVHAAAPPFLVVHGSGDSIIPVAQARSFVRALRGASRNTVGYFEIPSAQHGFDMFDGARVGTACAVTGMFLEEMHRRARSAGSVAS